MPEKQYSEKTTNPFSQKLSEISTKLTSKEIEVIQSISCEEVNQISTELRYNQELQNNLPKAIAEMLKDNHHEKLALYRIIIHLQENFPNIKENSEKILYLLKELQKIIL